MQYGNWNTNLTYIQVSSFLEKEHLYFTSVSYPSLPKDQSFCYFPSMHHYVFLYSDSHKVEIMIFSKFMAYIHSPPHKYVLSDPLLSTEKYTTV